MLTITIIVILNKGIKRIQYYILLYRRVKVQQNLNKAFKLY